VPIFKSVDSAWLNAESVLKKVFFWAAYKVTYFPGNRQVEFVRKVEF